MARLARRMEGFRPVRETFKGVRWRRSNRIWHETYARTDPRFPDACTLDWGRILKRPDTRHNDGRQLAIVSRRLGSFLAVYFLVYVKRAGYLHVISIRYAETNERTLFAQHFP